MSIYLVSKRVFLGENLIRSLDPMAAQLDSGHWCVADGGIGVLEVILAQHQIAEETVSPKEGMTDTIFLISNTDAELYVANYGQRVSVGGIHAEVCGLDDALFAAIFHQFWDNHGDGRAAIKKAIDRQGATSSYGTVLIDSCCNGQRLCFLAD